MEQLLDDIARYFEVGGYVMPPLALSALLLWYALGYRFSSLQRGGGQYSVRELLDRYREGSWQPRNGIVEDAIRRGVEIKRSNPPRLRAWLDDAFNEYSELLNGYRVLVRSIVVVSPLLGLLGTVAGMIETFDSLQEMAMFTADGGIAAGVSQALFTTQLGLVIAIPGMLLGRFLDKRQQEIERDLDQIKDILCSTPAEVGER